MFRVATVIVLLSMLSLYYVIATPGAGFALLVVSIWLFFTGFNALESMLPSLVSRVAPAASKGTAFGVYNSLQFFGVFVGGAAAGWLTGQYGSHAVFWLCGALVALWLFVSVFSAPFKLATTRVIRLPAEQSTGNTDALIARIRGVTGVQEVTIIAGESQAYLKVDEKELDDNALHAATYQ
jgi:MFS family permease